MIDLKKTMSILLLSSMAGIAMDTNVIDLTVPSSSHVGLAIPGDLSSGVSNSSIVITPSVPVTIPYKVYVSAVIDPNIVTSSVDGKEVFKMLGAEHKNDVAKFLSPQVCAPHVTLYQGEVDLAGDIDAEALELSLNKILNPYKNTTITVKDSEVGGMYGGGDSSYFIAYNVNDDTSELKVMVNEVEEVIGKKPKTYGNYETTMMSSGFKGMFSKHIPTTDNPFLHLSILRAYMTKKAHPRYGDALNKMKNIVDLYNNLRGHLNKTFTAITSVEQDEIIRAALEDYNSFISSNSNPTINVDNLVFKNGKTLDVLKTCFKNSFQSFTKKLCLSSEETAKAIVFLGDIINDPGKFIVKGKKGWSPKPDVQAHLLSSEGDFVVKGPAIKSENERADILCQDLQGVDIGDLTLKIIDYQISVSPKTIF